MKTSKNANHDKNTQNPFHDQLRLAIGLIIDNTSNLDWLLEKSNVSWTTSFPYHFLHTLKWQNFNKIKTKWNKQKKIKTK